MNPKRQCLARKIEDCRKEMISLALDHSLTDEQVVSTSIRLDQLLNEYSLLKIDKQ
ncbi:Spo0E family sporulation regulatory protein-aspartic acid phosphatase [Heyndrickxia sporothermodurans]